jgi:hypothetical protein
MRSILGGLSGRNLSNPSVRPLDQEIDRRVCAHASIAIGSLAMMAFVSTPAVHPTMIKLQLLLHRPQCSTELDPTLRERIEALGMRITAVGLATISAEMSNEDYEHLFGMPPPAVVSGCMHAAAAAPALPVPPDLAGAVTLITIAARHVMTTGPA